MTIHTARSPGGQVSASPGIAAPRYAHSEAAERVEDDPGHGIPREDPAPGTAHLTPPIGGWRCHDPRPCRFGWHIACPHCLTGRVLLAPDPADAFGYLIRPATCTVDCPARDVMRAFAWREGDMGLFFRWLDRQRPAGRAAA